MSTTTDVLSLFKYDPVADADSTFNITQGLNNNWDKLDAAILLAIAAAGAYNPEESYAVGDYCTYKGKLRKCSTAIPTGETWTEAHWTTTTVAAEMQELSSQLSKTLMQMNGINMLGDINNVSDLPSGRSALFRTTGSNWGGILPYDYAFYARLRSGVNGSYDAWLAFNGNKKFKFARVADNNIPESADWVDVATATPPQEHNLTLSAGVGNISGFQSVYFKSQENIVTVILQVSGTFSNGQQIATVPVDCFPTNNILVPCFNLPPKGFVGFLRVNTDGSVLISFGGEVSGDFLAVYSYVANAG